jgi:hypothetical protein
MNAYNPAVSKLDMPARIAKLPVDRRGYPVPRFVSWINGEPDFRVVSGEWVRMCRKRKLCFLCGERLGRYMAFTIGPMCSVNRISSEPPAHLECAQFAVRACPFLLHPQRSRNDSGLPEGGEQPAGIMILRNPGVSLIYIARDYKMVSDGNGGRLFKLGEPNAVEWWKQGRKATRDEVMSSIAAGLPILRAMAEKEGSRAVEELDREHARALTLVPA